MPLASALTMAPHFKTEEDDKSAVWANSIHHHHPSASTTMFANSRSFDVSSYAAKSATQRATKRATKPSDAKRRDREQLKQPGDASKRLKSSWPSLQPGSTPLPTHDGKTATCCACARDVTEGCLRCQVCQDVYLCTTCIQNASLAHPDHPFTSSTNGGTASGDEVKAPETTSGVSSETTPPIATPPATPTKTTPSTPAPGGVAIQCQLCNESIIGVRYRCQTCVKISLCSSCRIYHNRSHTLTPMPCGGDKAHELPGSQDSGSLVATDLAADTNGGLETLNPTACHSSEAREVPEATGLVGGTNRGSEDEASDIVVLDVPDFDGELEDTDAESGRAARPREETEKDAEGAEKRGDKEGEGHDAANTNAATALAFLGQPSTSLTPSTPGSVTLSPEQFSQLVSTCIGIGANQCQPQPALGSVTLSLEQFSHMAGTFIGIGTQQRQVPKPSKRRHAALDEEPDRAQYRADILDFEPDWDEPALRKSRPWNEEDRTRLRELKGQGWSDERVANELHRTPGAVAQQWRKQRMESRRA